MTEDLPIVESPFLPVKPFISLQFEKYYYYRILLMITLLIVNCYYTAVQYSRLEICFPILVLYMMLYIIKELINELSYLIKINCSF